MGIDVSSPKVEALAGCEAPFFETGLPELLVEAHAMGRPAFGTDPALAASARVHFICVGRARRPPT